MLSNYETLWSLAEALSWLKGFVGLSQSPTVMIDYRSTEVAAILLVLQVPNIRFCYWHIFRDLANKVKNKIPLSGFDNTLSDKERNH